MTQQSKDIMVKDGKGAAVGVGDNNKFLDNNMLFFIVLIIVVVCSCGKGFIAADEQQCCGRRRRSRRRSRSGLNNLVYLLLFALFMRKDNGRNTNTNIINVDSLGNGEEDLLDL